MKNFNWKDNGGAYSDARYGNMGWPKIFLILYPSLGNLTTHITIKKDESDDESYYGSEGYDSEDDEYEYYEYDSDEEEMEIDG